METKITRVFSMPNSKTFSIKPIRELISRYMNDEMIACDPFVGDALKVFPGIKFTNDLDPDKPADSHMDATEYLKTLPDNSVDLLLYDPPYSPRQVSESYKKMKMPINKETTQSSYWSKQKDEIARILKGDGVCISFGWNSNGVGIKRGFDMEEVLLIFHGGAHNDTIVTVERKRVVDRFSHREGNLEIREYFRNGISGDDIKLEIVKWAVDPRDRSSYCWVIAFIKIEEGKPFVDRIGDRVSQLTTDELRVYATFEEEGIKMIKSNK